MNLKLAAFLSGTFDKEAFLAVRFFPLQKSIVDFPFEHGGLQLGHDL